MQGQIFISYSHRDAEFFDAFQVQLKPWAVTGSLDIWTNQKIAPSQK